MNLHIEVACWKDASSTATEVLVLNESRLLEVLRGAAPPPFTAPVDEQEHWELRRVTFE